MPSRGVWARRLAVVAGALLVWLVVGHFLAPDLAHEDRPLEFGPRPTTNWLALQDYFDECLTQPVPLPQWRGAEEAGLVVVLEPVEALGLYELVGCFEAENMAVVSGAEVSAELRGQWLGAGQMTDLLVTSCGTGSLDTASRERFQREFLVKFGPVATD